MRTLDLSGLKSSRCRFVLFPKVPDALKVIYTDVALDPDSSEGHDGIAREDGVIMNDETVNQLCKQAVAQARAGADVVSPSDMMDGHVGEIQAALDAEGFQHMSIMSYTAKYASLFYGPFREALDSNLRFGDKKTEALIETSEDEAEGADILLVKPGLPYLDIIRLLRENSSLPIAAYQVSGEYSMIKAGSVLKMIDEERVMLESLMRFRQAGADIYPHLFCFASNILGNKAALELVIFDDSGETGKPITSEVVGAAGLLETGEPVSTQNPNTEEGKSRPRPSIVAWHRSPHSVFKLNVYGSALRCPSQSMRRGILRDSAGTLTFTFSTYYGVATNMEAEARALLEGLRGCIQKNIFAILVELDSIALCNMILNASSTLWMLDHVFWEIQALSSQDCFVCSATYLEKLTEK
ncbi:hypothetical protein ACH5RR_018198 [Cinchona calisaya]|uniref:Delta-aminolevulinic acid dehydratase n=1 Tax=Cinchona calisaya TaxID=153742 RepID=A0ABD2ZKQ8_9GENT